MSLGLFVTEAYAQSAGATPGAGGVGDQIMGFLPLILIVVVFYFLVIRPQSKRMKQHRDTVAAIRKGDRVMTAGGILGTVTKLVDDNEIAVEIADGVEVRVGKSTIADVIAKTEPVKKSGGKSKSNSKAKK